MVTFAIIGMGGRGRRLTREAAALGAKLVAVCDRNIALVKEEVDKYDLAPDMIFSDDEQFFARGKLADMLIIATQDELHHKHALKAIECGYEIALEKPISTDYDKCVEIASAAEKRGVKVHVCHSMRYMPFFEKIKELIDGGAVGTVNSINQTENVGYWHFAHAFVRGKWSRMGDRTPTIIAKCCHDLDMICWLMGTDVKSVSSVGGLTFFKSENAPEGSASHCFECKVREDCPYDCHKLYCPQPGWLINCLPYVIDLNNPEEVKKALSDKSHDFSRCVFACDNDAVDNQLVNVEFKSGATAHLMMNAFSKEIYREVHIHGTMGEIIGNTHDDVITVNRFGKETEIIDLGGHTKADLDKGFVQDVLESVEKGTSSHVGGNALIGGALASHKIGFFAEHSRRNGGKTVVFED